MISTVAGITFTGRVKLVATEGEIIPTDRMAFTLECKNEDGERVSTCDYVSAPVELPIGIWIGPGGDEPFSWTATTATTSVPPGDKYRDEHRGSFSFKLDMTSTGGDNLPYTVPAIDPEKFRCDSASYATRGSRCLFTRVTPTMIFDLTNEEYKESSLFIKATQELQPDILNINPQLRGKKVPGRFGESKLSYLYSGYDVDNSKKVHDQKSGASAKQA
ncbi:hypothetical protein [Amycolatopsis sp. WAC 01416]|uniref:hypothetical protein n=1 Tax=Amycolatopsis sp. WAC 01416 TaxID=2203196 RepID=UPI000F7B631D|nr:hypothetical protein [Amycolatopsis sp. WAC 01416]